MINKVCGVIFNYKIHKSVNGWPSFTTPTGASYLPLCSGRLLQVHLPNSVAGLTVIVDFSESVSRWWVVFLFP